MVLVYEAAQHITHYNMWTKSDRLTVTFDLQNVLYAWLPGLV